MQEKQGTTFSLVKQKPRINSHSYHAAQTRQVNLEKKKKIVSLGLLYII